MQVGKSGFSKRSTAAQVTAGLDLSGKTALITGVNSGLGFESMRALSAAGAHVIGAARTLEKAQASCSQIKGDTTPVACELSDFASVVACAVSVTALDKPIDILMCNAGIMALPTLEKKAGLELQFVTNHLGHYLLIRHLLDRVTAAPAGRIVMLSSGAHTHTRPGGIEFDNLSGDSSYNGWTFYGQSKLANLLTAVELNNRLVGTKVTANSVHPGIIQTNLGRNAGGFMTNVIKVFAPLFERTIEQGAATQCYVATHPGLEGIGGRYFADCNEANTSRFGADAELASKLWLASEDLVADYLPN